MWPTGILSFLGTAAQRSNVVQGPLICYIYEIADHVEILLNKLQLSKKSVCMAKKSILQYPGFNQIVICYRL